MSGLRLNFRDLFVPFILKRGKGRRKNEPGKSESTATSHEFAYKKNPATLRDRILTI